MFFAVEDQSARQANGKAIKTSIFYLT